MRDLLLRLRVWLVYLPLSLLVGLLALNLYRDTYVQLYDHFEEPVALGFFALGAVIAFGALLVADVFIKDLLGLDGGGRVQWRTYRGQTTDEVIAAYHADAATGLEQGWVATKGRWETTEPWPTLRVRYRRRSAPENYLASVGAGWSWIDGGD